MNTYSISANKDRKSEQYPIYICNAMVQRYRKQMSVAVKVLDYNVLKSQMK